MQSDEDLQKVLPRFEAVEQHYDGLNGKIIEWTLEHGNTNHDPSILAFVVGADGEVFASLMDGKQYQASAFTKWAEEQADAYEKLHPATRLPFVRGKVTVLGEGDEAEASCAALDEAREEGRPVLLYFGRGRFDEGDKDARREVKAARKFEGKTLDSKSAEKYAEGWVMLRFDLADEDHARLAEQFGVEEAPTLVLLPAGAEEPELLGSRTSAGALGSALRRHGETSDD